MEIDLESERQRTKHRRIILKRHESVFLLEIHTSTLLCAEVSAEP